MKLRVLTLFSGYDSQCMALDRLKSVLPGFDYDLIAWCEIDKYAIQAHNAVYPQYADRNLGDITKVDWTIAPPEIDIATWSFPCQSLSSAGLQRGMAKDSGTRSSLCWNAIECFRVVRPKMLLMENVKALMQSKFKDDFMALQSELMLLGYTNFFQVMNAKDYGVPQNRERVFMVSLLDPDRVFNFPKPFSLEKRIKDVLESDVPESYYLSQEQVDKIIAHCDRKQLEGCGFSTNFTPPLWC